MAVILTPAEFCLGSDSEAGLGIESPNPDSDNGVLNQLSAQGIKAITVAMLLPGLTG